MCRASSARKDGFDDKGVDEIVCVSVNDPFVMKAWGEATGADEAGIAMLGDAEGAFTKAIGMDFAAPPAGLIGRSKRYAMVVEDGVVAALHVEESPASASAGRRGAARRALRDAITVASGPRPRARRQHGTGTGGSDDATGTERRGRPRGLDLGRAQGEA